MKSQVEGSESDPPLWEHDKLRSFSAKLSTCLKINISVTNWLKPFRYRDVYFWSWSIFGGKERHNFSSWNQLSSKFTHFVFRVSFEKYLHCSGAFWISSESRTSLDVRWEKSVILETQKVTLTFDLSEPPFGTPKMGIVFGKSIKRWSKSGIWWMSSDPSTWGFMFGGFQFP